MDLKLDGRVALVAGGARGIGAAIALAFRAEGARVAVLDIDPNMPDMARQFDCSGWVADIADYANLLAVADEIRREYGRVDHVVNAAAIGSGKFGFPFWELAPSDWDRVLRVNIGGAVNVAHCFAPDMAKARRGTMLFLASVAGQTGSQTDPPYSASKAAVLNFVKCAARDLAPFGVRVNALCPGMVDTALNRSIHAAWAARQDSPAAEFEDWAAVKIKALVPLGRWQTPAEIAAVAVFLASDHAGSITGQAVNVDGGYVM